jgi:hypothetical protein
MTEDGQDRDALGAVHPGDAMAYLASRGWRRLGDVRRMARWVWPDDEGLEVLVPLEPRLVDFIARVHDLVLGLSLAEERSPDAVLRDLLAARTDAVRIRVRPPGERDGSIPIDDGVVLVQQARGLLVAAARSAVEPRAQHSHRPPNVVREYLNRVRLGQSERGSYVVTLLSPVGVDATVAERAGRLPVDDAFARRAVTTLAVALETAREAAERITAGHVRVRSFLETVERGVSANLCDALVKIGGRQQRGFSVTFGWAPVEPVRGLAVTIEFRDHAIPVLSQAAALLRTADEYGQGMLQGRVVRLQRQSDRGPGRVVVRGFLGQQSRRVAMDLEAEAYDLAILAHQQGLRIAVEGRLVREGSSWVLQDPRNFRPVPLARR